MVKQRWATHTDRPVLSRPVEEPRARRHDELGQCEERAPVDV